MKKYIRALAAVLLLALLTPGVALAATGKVTTINMTNLFNAYNSTKKTWNELKTAKHRLMGSFPAYCLQHKATVPNSQTYNLTDMMDNYSVKVRTGLQIIVENGYPFNNGGLSAAQAEYATANAIRFWLTECGDSQFYNMTNLGSFSDSKLRSLAAAGTITKKIQVRDAAYIPALQFSVELLIKARAQVLMEHSLELSSASVRAEKSGSNFVGSTAVTTVNLSGGYTLDKSALPAGSTVSGYTGKDGDVLTVSIPASEATANRTYVLTLTGRDNRVRSNMQVFCHNSDQAYQRVLCVRTNMENCAAATLTITTGSYISQSPDLTITSLTADSASYETGAPMRFTAMVRNQGTAAAGASSISLSGNGIPTQTKPLAALGVGASTTVTFTAAAPATAQTLTVTAFADCNDVIAESDEGNNARSVSVEIAAPKLYPDLTVTELRPGQDSYEADSAGFARVRITNQGAVSAGDFDVTLDTGLETWSTRVLELDAGQTKVLYFGFTTAPEPQNMTLLATVDSEDEIEESNEANNTASATIEVVRRKAPDLTVSSVAPEKARYNAGETVVIRTVIENQGEADAGSFVVRFTPFGMSEQTQTVNGLKVDQSITLVWTFPAPLLSETEVRAIAVLADSTDVIAESDETNNSGTGSVTILGEKPDLTITALNADAARYAPGATVAITATVKNNGNIACPVSEIQLSGDGIAMQTKSVAQLAPGASVNMTFHFAAPAIVGEETFSIRAMADPDDRIVESNERNNARDGSFTVYNPLPDLTVTQIHSDKSEYSSGERGVVTVTVKNQGSKAVSGSQLKLAIGSFYSETKQTGAIAAGQSVQVRFTFVAPETQEQMMATVTATADPTNEILESDETNNTLFASLAIKPALPDVGITATNATNWYAGMDVVATATVRSYTAQDYPAVQVRLTLGADVYEETIPLPGNGSNLAVFRVTLPAQPGAATLRFTVDPDDVLAEQDESNNDFEKTIQIVSVPAGRVLDPDLAELEESYRRSGLAALPTTENSNRHIWQEVRLENGAYVTKTFWAKLQTAFSVDPDSRIAYADKPDQMESGFGVHTGLTTQIATNYDRPEKLVGAQLAWVFAPESGYGQLPQWADVFDSLENCGGTPGAALVRWQQGVNPWSESESHLHYTPLWTPDGAYVLLCQSFYAWTPAGQMYAYDTDGVNIFGDMYDRVTAIQGR